MEILSNVLSIVSSSASIVSAFEMVTGVPMCSFQAILMNGFFCYIITAVSLKIFGLRR
ncbi:hypothetical protein IMAU10217_01788 [Lactiplantibacillus plantarum]|nr:hypothetical protein [Lactiplantibacillus plantarum]